MHALHDWALHCVSAGPHLSSDAPVVVAMVIPLHYFHRETVQLGLLRAVSHTSVCTHVTVHSWRVMIMYRIWSLSTFESKLQSLMSHAASGSSFLRDHGPNLRMAIGRKIVTIKKLNIGVWAAWETGAWSRRKNSFDLLGDFWNNILHKCQPAVLEPDLGLGWQLRETHFWCQTHLPHAGCEGTKLLVPSASDHSQVVQMSQNLNRSKSAVFLL